MNGAELSDQPKWIKALWWVGVPVVCLVFFMGQSAGYVPSPALDTNRLVTEHVAHDETNTALLRLICINTSKGQSTLARNLCLTLGQKGEGNGELQEFLDKESRGDSQPLANE